MVTAVTLRKILKHLVRRVEAHGGPTLAFIRIIADRKATTATTNPWRFQFS